jgi:hypothetical protein
LSCTSRPTIGAGQTSAGRRDQLVSHGPSRDRIGLALQLQRLYLLEQEVGPRSSVRSFSDQDGSRRGHLLQTGGYVHRVTRDQQIPTHGAGGQDLAGVDPDSHLKLIGSIEVPVVQLG